jgi:hypothetical protein
MDRAAACPAVAMGGEQRGQAAVVQPAGQWRITDGRGRWRGRGGAMVKNGRVEG